MKKLQIYATVLKKHPNEITHAISKALQKAGKPIGPTSNLRQIILLSHKY